MWTFFCDDVRLRFVAEFESTTCIFRYLRAHGTGTDDIFEISIFIRMCLFLVSEIQEMPPVFCFFFIALSKFDVASHHTDHELETFLREIK